MSWQGQHIKILAEKKKLTLKSLAAQVGVSRQALNDWARGQVPKGGHLLKLCKTLEVTPDAFFSSDRDSRITVPMHRARKTAKLTDSMQEKAKDLAAGYELLFREASDPGLVQSLRIYNKTQAEISKASSALRKLSGVANDVPMNFHHIFTLLKNLGVNLIFSDFHEKIKAYAFYTKINNHRVVFVNFKTKAFDFIFYILHESIHSIRDESDAYNDSLLYDNTEEYFCDEVASHAQLTNEYFSFVLETIQGLNKNDQLSQLARFAKKNNHTMHAIQKRIGSELPDFGDNLYRVETKLRKASPSMRDILFKTKDARGFVDLWKKISPIYMGHVIEQSDKLSSRRLCELLAIDSELDTIEVKAELVRIKSEG